MKQTLKARGIFISLEGIDGTGKSTQHRLLVDYLQQQGHRVVATREPGGTAVGERVREILLASHAEKLSPMAELTLMYAARAQHLDEVVRPALQRGAIVVSDRFNDASFAYQGYGRQLGVRAVRALDRVICGETQPDLTIVLDLEPRVALSRAQHRERQSKSRHGRFEAQGFAFHRRVREGYLAIAAREPHRVKLVHGDGPPDEIQAEVRTLVEEFLSRGRSLRRRARRAAR